MSRWISVDERLPEEDDVYLVAWLTNRTMCPYPHYYAMLTWDTDMEDWLDKQILPVEAGEQPEFLAWMPLPDFYKGE